MKLRAFTIGALVLAGIGFVAVVVVEKHDQDAKPTLAPAFQLMGKTTAVLDKALSKVILVNELDEKEFGEMLAKTTVDYATYDEARYLTALAGELSQFAKKQFRYRIYVYPSQDVNAYAMPGGLIHVSTGLLDALQSESELIAVLAHEMGHIELGHCMGLVKFELAAAKIKADTLGALLDFTRNLLVRHSFSKTQENEADDYAYATLVASRYDPTAASLSFQRLLDLYPDRGQKDVVDEYFASHPALKLRAAKYAAKAQRWWEGHRDTPRYVGERNLLELTPMSVTAFPSEWIERK